MSNLRGGVVTTDILQTLRVIDFSGIFLLEPTQNPFTLILSQTAKEVTENPEFTISEDAYFERFTRVNHSSGYQASLTSLEVDDADVFQAGDLILVTRTEEEMQVSSSNTTSNTIVVTRGAAGTTAAALVDNDELLNLGASNAENATSRQAMVTLKTEKTNYTQIFRRSIEFSRTQLNSRNYGQDRMDFERRKTAEEVARDIEYSFMFGSKSQTVGGAGDVERTTDGLLNLITENVTDLSGASLLEADFEAVLRDVFEYGSERKLAIGSPLFNSIISEYSKAKLETRIGESTYGIKITDYLSPHGSLSILEHRMLKGDVFGAWCWILDLDAIKYRFLTDSDVQLKTNIQPNDQDGQKDEIIGEVGLHLEHDKKHALLYNFTT